MIVILVSPVAVLIKRLGIYKEVLSTPNNIINGCTFQVFDNTSQVHNKHTKSMLCTAYMKADSTFVGRNVYLLFA